MSEPFEERVASVYRAVGKTAETDFSKVRTEWTVSPTREAMRLDFREGRSDGDLRDVLDLAIYRVVHLADALRAYARDHGRNPSDVQQAVDASRELEVLTDLSNRDKHWSPSRQTLSGIHPELTDVGRVLRLGVGGAGSASTVTQVGDWTISGSGTRALVTTATILDENGNHVGDLAEFLDAGLKVWERLLSIWTGSPDLGGA